MKTRTKQELEKRYRIRNIVANLLMTLGILLIGYALAGLLLCEFYGVLC